MDNNYWGNGEIFRNENPYEKCQQYLNVIKKSTALLKIGCAAKVEVDNLVEAISGISNNWALLNDQLIGKVANKSSKAVEKCFKALEQYQGDVAVIRDIATNLLKHQKLPLIKPFEEILTNLAIKEEVIRETPYSGEGISQRRILEKIPANKVIKNKEDDASRCPWPCNKCIIY